jgi:DMSO/TMAO reductase YedYZ molybdopterin-dependent catalytic subunit
MTEDRRAFFARVARWLGGWVVGGASVQAWADSTRQQGAPVRAYGARARHETAARWLMPTRYPSSSASWTPLAALDGTITPSALHFERHHGGVPSLDPATFRLLVHGLVQRPLEFSVA